MSPLVTIVWIVIAVGVLAWSIRRVFKNRADKIAARKAGFREDTK